MTPAAFYPSTIYDTATSRLVAMILRPGKTPSGREVRGHLRCLVRAIRRHWPNTAITIRSDGHYGRPEAMDWCEDNGVTYVFGLTGTKALAAKIDDTADHIRVVRALGDKESVRGFAETTHAAKSWRQQRRVAARIEATRLGLDIRYVVTNITTGTPEWLYAELYYACGQAENLIKLHKSQLASDRTSCRHLAANQMRLVLHTAAYWLMLTVREACPYRMHTILTDNVLRSEEGRLARQQVSVREHAPAASLSSTSIQAAPADPEELSAIANTGSSRCTRHRGPHRPQHEMPIQAGDPSIIYRVGALTPSRLH